MFRWRNIRFRFWERMLWFTMLIHEWVGEQYRDAQMVFYLDPDEAD